MLSFYSPPHLNGISTVDERNNNKNRISLDARMNRKRFYPCGDVINKKGKRASEVTFMSPVVVHNAFNKLDYHLMQRSSE